MRVCRVSVCSCGVLRVLAGGMSNSAQRSPSSLTLLHSHSVPPCVSLRFIPFSPDDGVHLGGMYVVDVYTYAMYRSEHPFHKQVTIQSFRVDMRVHMYAYMVCPTSSGPGTCVCTRVHAGLQSKNIPVRSIRRFVFLPSPVSPLSPRLPYSSAVVGQMGLYSPLFKADTSSYTADMHSPPAGVSC